MNLWISRSNRLLHYLMILAFLLAYPVASQASWRGKVRSGDKLYEKEKYDDALVKYLEALGGKGDSTLIHFDLGNVFQKQEKFPEAGQSFQSSILARDSLTRADALYNLGNALVGAQKYPEAVKAYKSALNLHPEQRDYLHNLELALRLMKKPPEQQQKQDQQNQNKKDQNKDQQQQDQQKQDQQQKDQQQKEQPEQQNQQNQDQQQPQMAGAMSKEEAERLLNAIQTDEKQVQENLHKQAAVEAGVAKDW